MIILEINRWGRQVDLRKAIFTTRTDLSQSNLNSSKVSELFKYC